MKGSVNTKYKHYVLCFDGIWAQKKMYSTMLSVSKLEDQLRGLR